MTVSQLIAMLNSIENPEEARIMFRDSAAGNREIGYVEKIIDEYYVLQGKPTKRGK